MSGFVVAYDAIRVNIPSLPPGARQYAGYATGSGDVPWTEQDFADHATALGPCLRIDQDPAASDPAADLLDVEEGAATISDCPWWAKRALKDFQAARRPGQRPPAIYCSASNVTAVVNSLVTGGVTSGVGLHVANWSLTEAQALADVLAASGPFPVVGIQFTDDGAYDVSVFSAAWLARQSGKPAPAPVPPPPRPAPVPVPDPVPAWQEAILNKLPVLQEGATDEAGQVFWVHRLQALAAVYAVIAGAAFPLATDGVFGAATAEAVRAVQHHAGIAADGVVGPHTWGVLIAGSAT
jgi:peptidoglycan hydrolase-like protein with peptidoglycan-binding domain